MVEYDLSHVFTALGDPTRRAIMARLKRGPASVTALAEPFDVSLNAISKHIKILERAGVVRREREGRVHTLSLNAGALERASKYLIDYHDFWSTRLARLASVAEKR